MFHVNSEHISDFSCSWGFAAEWGGNSGAPVAENVTPRLTQINKWHTRILTLVQCTVFPVGLCRISYCSSWFSWIFLWNVSPLNLLVRKWLGSPTQRSFWSKNRVLIHSNRIHFQPKAMLKVHYFDPRVDQSGLGFSDVHKNLVQTCLSIGVLCPTIHWRSVLSEIPLKLNPKNIGSRSSL
jgi:hypothetical protein